jgi:hypothetical protein
LLTPATSGIHRSTYVTTFDGMADARGGTGAAEPGDRDGAMAGGTHSR